MRQSRQKLSQRTGVTLYHAGSAYAVHAIDDSGDVPTIGCGTAIDWRRREKAKAETLNEVTCVKCVRWALSRGLRIHGLQLQALQMFRPK